MQQQIEVFGVALIWLLSPFPQMIYYRTRKYWWHPVTKYIACEHCVMFWVSLVGGLEFYQIIINIVIIKTLWTLWKYFVR